MKIDAIPQETDAIVYAYVISTLKRILDDKRTHATHASGPSHNFIQILVSILIFDTMQFDICDISATPANDDSTSDISSHVGIVAHATPIR